MDKQERQITRLKEKLRRFEIRFSKRLENKHIGDLKILKTLGATATVTKQELDKWFSDFEKQYPYHEVFFDGDLISIVAMPTKEFEEIRRKEEKLEKSKSANLKTFK